MFTVLSQTRKCKILLNVSKDTFLSRKIGRRCTYRLNPDLAKWFSTTTTMDPDNHITDMSDMISISPTLQSKLYMEQLEKEGKIVHNFGLGQNSVKQPSLYTDLVKKYAHKKEYTSSQGIDQLNKSLKTMYDNDHMSYNILVGNGLKELLFIVQCAFKGKIIHVTPSWVSYKEHIDVLERNDDLIQIKTSIQNNFRIDLDILEKTLQDIGDNNQKMILLNYPNNPTGICYSNKELKSIGKILKKYNCLVFGDEIYLNLAYNSKQKSLSYYIPDLVIRGSSVSKDLACGGYRIGWCAFPQTKTMNELFAKCCQYGSSVYSCAPVPIQYATNEFICNNKENYDSYIEKSRILFSHIADKVKPLLNKTELIYPGIEASWYVYIDFINYKNGLNKLNIYSSIDLSNYLMINHNIITVAAQHFGDDSLSLRLSLIDFEYDIEKNNIENLNIDKMILGIEKLIKFLNSLE
jgi:aspartate aminotransferase